jgi:hypothetical protein
MKMVMQKKTSLLTIVALATLAGICYGRESIKAGTGIDLNAVLVSKYIQDGLNQFEIDLDKSGLRPSAGLVFELNDTCHLADWLYQVQPDKEPRQFINLTTGSAGNDSMNDGDIEDYLSCTIWSIPAGMAIGDANIGPDLNFHISMVEFTADESGLLCGLNISYDF